MKMLMTLSVLWFNSTVLAGNLSVTYDNAKFAQCSVSLEYFGGDKNRVTCSAQDIGTDHSAGSTVTLQCQRGGEVSILIILLQRFMY